MPGRVHFVTVASTVSAWPKKPCYLVIGESDREIDPELLRFMARRAEPEAVELEGPHAIFLVHPKEIAALIEKGGGGWGVRDGEGPLCREF